MSFAKVFCAQTNVLKAELVSVEVDVSGGLHAFSIVGLPDKAVDESKDRVSAALKNNGFASPKQKNQKVVVSLAPADLRKERPIFDVGIALAYLLATKAIAFDPNGKLFLGELSLDGEVRPVSGALALSQEAKRLGFKEIYVPKENAEEAALISGITVYGFSHLTELLAHIHTKDTIGSEEYSRPHRHRPLEAVPQTMIDQQDLDDSEPTFSDIRGQENAKRALEIAAAGGHNVALWGPPGTGKTMLARALQSILPRPSFDEILEMTAIHSVAGTLEGSIMTKPPVRSPHHTASYVSIIGGGAHIKPGEVTLAHRGVLFLDEFPEFDRKVIETLRQPLEDHYVSISRAKGSVRFPARFILVAAYNPCPCGNLGDKQKRCTCPAYAIERYERKISGPIIDRIDLWSEVSRIPHSELSQTHRNSTPELLAAARGRVLQARERQRRRFKDDRRPLKTNSELTARDIDRYVILTSELRQKMNRSASILNLSPRAYHRVLKLTRTIADLDGADDVQEKHLMEALQYRPKERV